jgi:hypothetical protein
MTEHSKLIGKYKSPWRVKLGAVLYDAVRGEVIVTGLTAARMAWPIGKRAKSQGRTLVVLGTWNGRSEPSPLRRSATGGELPTRRCRNGGKRWAFLRSRPEQVSSSGICWHRVPTRCGPGSTTAIRSATPRSPQAGGGSRCPSGSKRRFAALTRAAPCPPGIGRRSARRISGTATGLRRRAGPGLPTKRGCCDHCRRPKSPSGPSEALLPSTPASISWD